MWFKELKDHEPLLKPALDVWPVLNRYFEKRGRIVNKLNFTSIHYRYCMDLKDIEPGAKLPKKPEGMRVLVSDSDGPLAFHDMSINPKKPRVFCTRLDAGVIKDFLESTKRLKNSGFAENDGEVRQLNIFSLNVEATWHHNDSKNVFFTRKPGSTELESMDEAAFRLYLTKLKFQLEKGFNEIKDQNGGKLIERIGG